MKKLTQSRKGKQKTQSGEAGLLPCPFCGGEAETVKSSFKKITITGCVRSACMASVISVTEVEGRQKWNLRIGPAAYVKLPAQQDAVAERMESGL